MATYQLPKSIYGNIDLSGGIRGLTRESFSTPEFERPIVGMFGELASGDLPQVQYQLPAQYSTDLLYGLSPAELRQIAQDASNQYDILEQSWRTALPDGYTGIYDEEGGLQGPDPMSLPENQQRQAALNIISQIRANAQAALGQQMQQQRYGANQQLANDVLSGVNPLTLINRGQLPGPNAGEMQYNAETGMWERNPQYGVPERTLPGMVDTGFDLGSPAPLRSLPSGYVPDPSQMNNYVDPAVARTPFPMQSYQLPEPLKPYAEGDRIVRNAFEEAPVGGYDALRPGFYSTPQQPTGWGEGVIGSDTPGKLPRMREPAAMPQYRGQQLGGNVATQNPQFRLVDQMRRLPGYVQPGGLFA